MKNGSNTLIKRALLGKGRFEGFTLCCVSITYNFLINFSQKTLKKSFKLSFCSVEYQTFTYGSSFSVSLNSGFEEIGRQTVRSS